MTWLRDEAEKAARECLGVDTHAEQYVADAIEATAKRFAERALKKSYGLRVLRLTPEQVTAAAIEAAEK